MGPMFAGKSSAILRMVNRYQCLGWNICIITHSADDRYSAESMLMNHDEMGIPCEKWSALMDHIADPDFLQAKLVIIDEAQNLTPKQMRALITRSGPGTKVVCLGNIGQIDTPYLTETTCGLTYVVNQFKSWSHSGHLILTRGERSALADYATAVL